MKTYIQLAITEILHVGLKKLVNNKNINKPRMITQNDTLLSVRVTTAAKNTGSIRKQGSKVKTVNTVTLVATVTPITLVTKVVNTVNKVTLVTLVTRW